MPDFTRDYSNKLSFFVHEMPNYLLKIRKMLNNYNKKDYKPSEREKAIF
jgi:hypothetical protein